VAVLAAGIVLPVVARIMRRYCSVPEYPTQM
jgi:hypothetical protein